MSEKEGVHFAEAEGDLPPPHLPFDLPLVPMDPNIFDAKENHPLKDRIRHDGVPYSQVIAAEQEHEEQQVEVPPLLHRKSTVVNLHQLSRKNSIRMEKTHKKVKSKLMAAEPQTVTYQEKKNSAALKFPVDVIQQSQQRLKKAAASSNRQSRRPREAAPSILNSVLDDELNGADDSGASYRSTIMSRESSKSSFRDAPTPQSLPLHLPSIVNPNKESVTDDRLYRSLHLNPHSGTSSRSRTGFMYPEFSSRTQMIQNPDQEFEDNPNLLLHDPGPVRDDFLSRITKKKQADEAISPLVAGWRSDFAKKKQTLDRRLRTQLDDRNEDRVLGNHSRRVMSKAYKEALEDAASLYHDGVPKKTVIWQRARQEIMRDSPNASRVAQFNKEMQKFREQARDNKAELPLIKNVYTSIKIYLEQLRPLDDELIHYLITHYGEHRRLSPQF
eukprot:TRINITY_DN529_c0_g1_i11.p1 TRINITY_DN529_c0_g1~~TRINITY_DN529_c0_g1_i11.p1  ORF type:complete len:443 (+),score=84.58 TRINITY_DN529_c0_g1_i11:59-1387(+)